MSIAGISANNLYKTPNSTPFIEFSLKNLIPESEVCLVCLVKSRLGNTAFDKNKSVDPHSLRMINVLSR